MGRNNRNFVKFWQERMHRLDSLWEDDFTPEERNILSACIEKVMQVFHVGYIQSYKIVIKYEEWKGIYLYRGSPDIDRARSIRLAKEDKSYTEFGKLFYKQYGIKPTEDNALYSLERNYYRKYGICSWLDERCIIHNGRKHHLKDTACLIYKKFGILRCENPDLYDAIWQHYKIYGNLNIGKRGKFLSQIQNATKSNNADLQTDD